MRKIPTLFERDWSGDRSRVLARLNVDEASVVWVIEGHGVATRKRDGTATLVRDGRLYRRYDAKAGRTPPAGFEPVQPEPDAQTGHWPGWVSVNSAENREDWWYALAPHPNEDGTYEFCGPRVGQNHEKLDGYTFFRHGAEALDLWEWVGEWPRDIGGWFDVVQGYLGAHPIEGIVWHHQDGRMCKVKRRDFGFPWPAA